jgi:hypothetical protein
MVAEKSLLNKGLLNIQLRYKHFLFFSKFLSKILLLLCLLCLSIVTVWAEGSKELNPAGGDRVYLQSSTNANENVPFPSQGLVRVYAKQGEVLYLGSSAQGVGNGTIRVIAPNGTLYNSGASTIIGRINNRTEELAGPGAGGYTPYTITVGAGQEGVWSVFFIPPGNAGGNAGSAIDAAGVNAFASTQRGNTEYIIAFDVSVRNTANTAFILGRAYMNGFAASMQSYNRKFKSTFYVQTFDGYLYEVIPQDKTGYIFNFFSNNKGVRDVNGDPTYQSFNSTEAPAPNIHHPFSEDTATDVTHKIFFNNPSTDLPLTAQGRIHGGAYPAATTAGTFWLKKTPTPPYASDVTFVGKEGTTNKAGTSPLGGYIHFKTNQPGSFFVNIDVNSNGSFTDPIDVKIEGPAITGDNVMYWDGRDGLGNKIYGNIIIQPDQMNIVLRGGEVHFPFTDVENNLGGIIIKRMNGVEDPDDIVYWDDSNITNNSAGAGPSNPISTGFMGVSSSTNGHKWGTNAYSGNAFGNEVVLDTWSYILSRPVIPYMDITFRESDLEVVSLVSSKDSYCVGETIEYTITVRNNGPNAVEGATLFFNHPSQFLINGLTGTASGAGTHSFISSNSTTYTTSLNLANQELMTFVFSGKLTDYINTGELNANAIIMRPRDVNDPDATNPDDAPPTDPFLECPAGNCASSNNYKEKNNISINKVDISIYSASVIEGNSGDVFIEFPVTLSAISSCDIYVDFELEHIDTNNDDFLLGTTGTLTIPAGTLETVLKIKINPDLIIERNEQFKVVLSDPSGGNTLDPIYYEAIGLITNDDTGLISLMAINGEEESILPITKHAKFIFSFPPGIKSDTDTEIFYVLSGSAEGNGIDYIGATGTPAIGVTPANPISIVIPAGDQSVELILPVVDDEIVEGDEEINIDVVSLVSPYAVPHGLSITFTSAEVKAKIVDNDVAVLTLSAAIEEEEGNDPPMKQFVYTLSLDKKTKSGFSVDYSTFDEIDGATLLDNDYELSSGFLVFEKDSIMTDTIRVTVNGDDKIEADERFKLILSNLSNTFGGRLTLSQNETYGKIINDDFANIKITPDDGKEGSKSVEFRFELEDGKISDKNIVIEYKLEGGTAASGSDYDGAITGTITILAGSNYATLVLPAKIDGIIEGTETVILEVISVSTPYPFVTVINPLVTANIEDIDTGTISIGNAIIDEGNANTTFLNFPVTLSKATQEDVEITFSTQDFTAIAGEDYIAQINQTLVFTKTAETKNIRIEIKGDKKIELNEIFYVLINHIDRTFGGNLTLGTSTGNGTIRNDDSGAITIEPHDGEEELEVAGRFIFKLPQDVTAGEDITITYSLSGTALIATDDYTVNTYGTFILPAGTNSKSLDILVNDDEIIEGTESVIIDIVNVSSVFPSSSLSTSIASQTLNILDNDTGIITLIPPVNTNEGALGVNHVYNFGIRLDKATQGPFVVKYHTEDGTASTTNVDYAGVTSQITFPSNTANHTIYIPVTIYGDNIIEANETFRFILDEIVEDYGGRLTIVNGAATSTIINDDAGGVSITPASGTEGGANPSFTFSLPPGIKADQDIKISYSLWGGAVGNGSDFVEGMSGTVTIDAGDNAAFLQLTLVDDAVVEGNELVNLTVTNFEAQSGVTLIDNSSSLTIFDNDNAEIIIEPVSIDEGNGGYTNFVFNVSLNTQTKESFSLKYSTIANSALPGEDYVEIIGGDLGFDTTIGTRTITIQVKGDKKVELNERFYVQLFNLSKNFDGHLRISTTQGRATGIIVNDDTPKIVIVPTHGDEDGLISGVFRFKYDNDYTSSTDTEIRYDLFGSADSGIDYDLPLSGVFIIPAGDNYYDLILPIIQDEIVEDTETVGIVAEINSALAGITFPVKTSQLNIFDDDEAKISVSVDPASANETNFGETTTVRFTITLDKQTKTGFSLSYYTEDISTDDANDYNPESSTIGFSGNAGETKYVDVVIKGDNTIESNEQFQLIIYNLTENFNNRLTIAKDRETATILNDDFGQITIYPTHAVEGSVDGAFTFRLPPDITVNENVVINYQLSSLNASSLTDYTAALSSFVTIEAGQNEVTLPIPIINDNVLEIQESLTLTITSIVNTHGITAVSNVSTITIDDDDTASVTLIAPTNRTEKDSDEETVTFLVRINQPIGLGVNIPFNTSNVSATAGEDYIAVNSTLYFPISPVAQELPIEVKIKGDKKIEKDEIFNLILGALSQNFEDRLTFDNNSVPYTIINDDQSKIIITKFDGKEGNITDPYFRFSLETGYTSDEPITFNYDFQGSTNASDYTTTNPTTITIPANGSYVDVIFNVIDDEIVEDTETIAFNSLSISSAYPANITLETAPRPIVNIEDNDVAELKLIGDLLIRERNTGEEPEAIYTIELTKSTQEPFNINLATAIGTALSSDFDFIPYAEEIIHSGDKDQVIEIRVKIIGDTKVEADEDFLFKILSITENYGGRLTIPTNSITTVIENDDAATITITPKNGEESLLNDKPGVFTFSLPAGITVDRPIIISYSLAGKAQSGSDYVAVTGSVTLEAGSNSVDVVIDVIDDAIIEGDENLILTASIPSPVYGIGFKDNINTSTLIIKDNDRGTVSIDNVSVTEGHSGTPTLTFTVSLSGDTQEPFKLYYETADGTATTSDDDYVGVVNGELTINQLASATNSISITYKGDRKVEADETFRLILKSLEDKFSGHLTLHSTDHTGTATIENDDSAIVRVTAIQGKEDPLNNQPAGYIFTLVDGLGNEVSSDQLVQINYQLGGTAQRTGLKADYTTLNPTTISIPAGSSSATVYFNVIDDAILEISETILLENLIVNGHYAGITLSTAPLPVARIEDNDVAKISVSAVASMLEGHENEQDYVFTISLDKETSENFVINYHTTNGTALSGEDYIGITNSQGFTGTAGESYAVNVRIKGDHKVEPDEVFNFIVDGLTKTFEGRLTIETPSLAATITNDDSTELRITKQDGEEGVNHASFTFSLTNGKTLDTDLYIRYTLDGIADQGLDYTLSQTNPILLPKGQNSIQLLLSVVDDNIIEDSESVTIETTIDGINHYGITFSPDSEKTLNIIDNDEGILTIENVSITEGDTGDPDKLLLFTVTLSNPTASAFSVKYHTENASATAPADYIGANNPLTDILYFNGINIAGETRQISIPIKGDLILESDEDFYVHLSSLSENFNNRLKISIPKATGTIEDNDVATLIITKTDGKEQGTVPVTFTFSFENGRTSDQPTVIAYKLGGTALGGGVDYTDNLGGSITIPAGQPSATLILPVNDDDTVEGDETIRIYDVVVSSIYNSRITLNPNVDDAIIEDNDWAKLSINGPLSVTEGDSGSKILTFEVSLDKATASSFKVKYRSQDQTAISYSTEKDFEAVLPSEFNFSGVKDEKKTINVVVYGDTRVEEDEYFNILLEDLSTDFYGRLSINSSPARGNIIDNDNLPGNKIITITKVDGEEKPDGSKPASFTFSFPPGISLDTDTEIFFSFDSDATAKNVEDYTVLGSTSSIIIKAGKNSETLILNVNDDLVIEDTETVTIVTGNINNYKYNGITIDNPIVSLNIDDNDRGTLNISSISLPEGHSGTQTFNFVVTLSNPTSRDFTVHYKTKDGTATIEDDDYEEAEGDLYFIGQSGQTQNISVTIKGDRRVEEDEFFEVLLSQLSDNFNGRLSIPVDGKGTIRNDDSSEITITKTDGKEGEDPVTFTLSFPNGAYSDKPTTIHYKLLGTASGNGIDYYGNIDTLITIPANTEKVEIVLPVVDDLLVEEDETVIFQIKQIDSFYGNQITYNPNIPVAIIRDNDEATLSIDGPITVKEGDFGTKTVTFTVTLDRHMGRSFKVSYETVDGSAKFSDDDYVTKTGELEFAGNLNEKHQISIDIKGDRKVEGTEDLLVRLFNLTDDFNDRLTIKNSPAKIIIEDDDNIEVNKFITITKQDGEEKPDGSRPASFTFSLPAGVSLDEETRINYSLDGSAKGNNEVVYDYEGAISSYVTIPAGSNSIVLTLPVYDDDIVEETETIRLTTGQIENETYNDIRVVNSPQTVNIIDNDSGILRVDDFEIEEGDDGITEAIFKVHLSKATSLPFTVDYSTENGTATVADADYNPITGSKLSFSGAVANEIREIRVYINGDKKIEADETFKVLLSNLSNLFEGRLSIERTTAVGTIKNDDNAIIKVTGRNGMENGPQAAQFIFSFPSGYTADVPTEIVYRLGGTAIAGGTDFTGIVEGSIIIKAGDERAILELPVIDDEIVEDDETISIIIKSIITNYNSNITYDPELPKVKIIDNDRTVLKLSDPLVLDEGNSGTTQFVYTVTLEKATGKPFTIKYRTADGTAKLVDNDYSEAIGTLSFSGTAGETRTVVVFVNGDLKIEANETFNFTISDLDNNFNNRLSLPLVSTSVGTIKNDDNGIITITKLDGREGEDNGKFIFTLPPGVTSDKDITINYRLGGTAGTSDYVASPSASSITIPAGKNSVVLDVLVNDDNFLEQRETVILTVTRIINPYNNVTVAAPIPVLYIYDNDTAEITVSSPTPIYEGNTGSIKSVKFNITLDKTTDRGFTISYNTVDGTAKTVDNDYQAKSGKFNFSGYAGETKIVEVFINGDIRLENDETFELNISGLTVDFDGNMLLGPNGVATILNDDVAPNAVDDYAVTPEDTPITFSITENDTHGEGVNPATVVIITQPEKGKLEVHSNGTVTYIPNLDLNGEDYFVYTVKDINGIVSNEAYVFITILPVNDPPVANDDVFYVEKGTSLRENVSLNDTDPDEDVLSFELNTYPTNGNIVFFDPSDGGFIYIPNDDFKGVDTFKYSVYDIEGLRDEAEVTIYVQPRVIVNLTPNYQVLIEGDSIYVTATISEFLYQDVNITLSFGGTAEVDKDYTLSGNYDTIMIPAGDTTTTQKFCIKVLKDFIQDDGETIQVRIVGLDPSEFITVGKETDILITDFYPVVVPPGPGENGDITPDPYLSPNGDGLGNERFIIYNIEKYLDNEVIIFNRWGNEVYRMTGYNNHDKSFVGVSNSGLLSNSGALLVDGVYYFIIYTKPNGTDTKLNKGYIIMKR